MTERPLEIVLGPLFFNWPARSVRDFYAAMADEALLDRVYLGEVICGKRASLLGQVLVESAERLERAGKSVVWSSLALPTSPRDLRATAEMAAGDALVELNDVSGLVHLGSVTKFVAGPLLSVYNEAAAVELMKRGCVRLCAHVELPLADIAAISRSCPSLELEVFAFGRLPLALSGRCYHARFHGLRKDSCRFVCARDPDGLTVRTVEKEPFLAINGVQTLSYAVQAADLAPADMRNAGVGALRLSPHTCEMLAVVHAFRAFADGAIDSAELRAAIAPAAPGPLVNGYLRGRPGMLPAGAV